MSRRSLDEDVHGAAPPRARRESVAGFRAKMGSNSGTMASADEGLLLVKERYQEFMTTQVSVSNLVRICARLRAAVARSAAQCDCTDLLLHRLSAAAGALRLLRGRLLQSRCVPSRAGSVLGGACLCLLANAGNAASDRRTPERPPRDLTPTVRDAQSCAPWACASSFFFPPPTACCSATGASRRLLRSSTLRLAKMHAH